MIHLPTGHLVEIQTTGNTSPPDRQPPGGMSCASSTVWCRVTRGEFSTGWHECEGVRSIMKASAMFREVQTIGALGFAWSLVTQADWPGEIP